jgi:hypothetical protein
VGDNPNDITDTKYGNNNVIKEPENAAGIVVRLETTILRRRIANNVEIVRAVPDGDEIKILHLVFVMQLIMARNQR